MNREAKKRAKQIEKSIKELDRKLKDASNRLTMRYAFHISLMSWSPFPAYHYYPKMGTQPLISTDFVEVYIQEEVTHKDNSITPWHLVVCGHFFRLLFYDKEQILKAIDALSMLRFELTNKKGLP